METAEVHSMSMEFLTYPWMPLFFGDNTEEFFFHHIAGSLTFIPYGTIVDYFQQVIYDNPDMTPAARVEFFNEIEKEFLPWFTTEGIPAFEDGRRWQRQSHIFESPFYYIDYCLAQFTALQFLALSRQDFKSAFDKYVRFVSFGGTKNFVELLKSAELLSPFEEDSFKLIVKSVEEILKV
jgi:M3 family oligoendopeptidase